jgi:hypothetical protein
MHTLMESVFDAYCTNAIFNFFKAKCVIFYKYAEWTKLNYLMWDTQIKFNRNPCSVFRAVTYG